MTSMRTRAWVAGAIVALMLGMTGTAPASIAAPSGADGAEPAVPAVVGPGATVTLITGDVVRMGPGGESQVVPGPGRTDVRFVRQLEYGELFVIPADVANLVATGRLDRRLFNVSELVEFGYDDRSRSDLPLIVELADERQIGAASAVLDVPITQELPSIGAVAVEPDKSEADEFWTGLLMSPRSARQPMAELAANIDRVWLDGPTEMSLDQSVSQVGAAQAWRLGQTGNGVTVGVLDTGVDGEHPDLLDAVTDAQDFTGSESGPVDLNGHGTHVASIITGNGAAADGRYVGVAPDAHLLNGRVLDENGRGQESWVIAGMQWAAEAGADIVNLSLGVGMFSDGTDPTSRAVDELTASTGTLFVAAAGNSQRPSDYGISAPATADSALAVGAVDRTDELADFSSLGPRMDEAIKPDITAPGVGIVAARAAEAKFGEPGQSYAALSGTSMATPHVAGAAAILAGQHPEWSAEQLKAALMGSAVPHDGLTVYHQGGGRLDVERAVTQAIAATPSNLSFGLTAWPHDDDRPITSTITYRNAGAEPVVLDLAVDARDESGRSAPEGMFTVSSDQLVVAAGGSAHVDVTADTTIPAEGTRYGGYLTATTSDEKTVVRTPVGVTREAESYEVKVRHTDPSGNPANGFWGRFVSIDRVETHPVLPPFDGSGVVTLRLPKGHYYFEVWSPSESWFIAEPHVDVSHDIELHADARDAASIAIDAIDQPSAKPADIAFAFLRDTAWGDTGLVWNAPNFDDLRVRPSETAAPSGQFTFLATADLASPDGDGGFTGSPFLYRLQSQTDGHVPGDLTYGFRDDELAHVKSTHASSDPGTSGLRDYIVASSLPFTLDEFYTPGLPVSPHVAWLYPPGFTQVGESGAEYALGQVEPVYEAGKTVRQRWNVGVFGPAFPHTSAAPAWWAGRSGDEIRLNIPLFTDQAAHRYGFSAVDAASTTLYYDGDQVGESVPKPGQGIFRVPSDGGTYQLTVDATRSVSKLSTRISATWTFSSKIVDGPEQPLPLLAVRFAPDLDDNNQAPAGHAFTVPVHVQRNGQGAAPELADLTVQASFDDGVSWQPVRLVRDRSGWRAMIRHPRGAEFVSLRATAVDTDGSKVEQTITRAYALG